MKNAFDKDLKQRLEEVSMPDTGFSFDKEKIWNTIAHRRKKKVIPLLPWLSHIAAVAAGLAIGFFFFVQKKQEPAPVAIQQQPQAIQRVTDTIYLVKEEAQHTVRPGISTQKQIKQPVTVARKEQEPLMESPYIQEPPQPLPVQRVTAATGRIPPKVLHLADMNNENTSSHTPAKQGFALLKHLGAINGETNPETFSMMIDKKIFRSQN